MVSKRSHLKTVENEIEVELHHLRVDSRSVGLPQTNNTDTNLSVCDENLFANVSVGEW